MKRTIKLAVVAALALGTTSAFATNGSTLTGLGAKSRGMAGTGIGMSHGAESALTNPALITSIKKDHEISFGGTIFMPDVSNSYGTGAPSKDSAADLSVIPEVSVAAKITDNFYMGVGMWGTAGMGVDYRTEATQMNMVTNLQLMQFGVPLAYKTNGLSIAVTPILQYGSLDINYKQGANTVGAGQAQDLAFGYSLGVAYEISSFTVGAVYKSEIDMDYTDVMSTTMAPMTGSAYKNNELGTPAEMGIGASYTMGEHTVAVDYKIIQWSDTKGYEDFKWDDQDVIAIGYEYATTQYALRVGYNYASSPISDQLTTPAGANGLQGPVINMFNLLGFPATIESHYAIGGTYNLSETVSFDAAFSYAPEVTETMKVPDGSGGVTGMTTKHSQTGITAQINFAF